MQTRVLVTGAGGFIGYHLVAYLRSRGCWVRGVDLKRPLYGPTGADEFELLDLRDRAASDRAMRGIDEVYALAADMGGMGFISQHHAHILHNNLLIDLNTVESARVGGVRRLLYASSACVYPEHRQTEVSIAPLREEEAYPAFPADAYGWEKLVSERLCTHYCDESALDTRIVRFHNIFGPFGTWDGGREKAPAAICRKVAIAKLTGDPVVEIWGDGQQTRSFCYIDDCLRGIDLLMRSEFAAPLNVGQDRMVTINEMADIVADIAGISIVKKHVPGPQGVRGRNSDNTRVKEVLGWQPLVSLEEGLARTYRWIEERVAERLTAGGTMPRRAACAQAPDLQD